MSLQFVDIVINDDNHHQINDLIPDDVDDISNESDEEFDSNLYTEEDYKYLETIEEMKNDEKNICLHKNIICNNDIEMCTDCGIEIYKDLSFEPEWRFYGDNDSKHSLDPSRCHIRKNEEKSIYKDIEQYNFPVDIIKEINRLYFSVTQGKIRRGNFRKAIIFACTFNAYKNQNNPHDTEELREQFQLTKKIASKGLTFYNLNKRNNEKIDIEDRKKNPIYVSPVSFIPRVMKKFNANDNHIIKVTELYNRVYNRSKLLNRSNPQSVISGLIYYYFKLIGGNITCSKFSKIVKLSEITVNRIAKNISDILKTTDKVNLI